MSKNKTYYYFINGSQSVFERTEQVDVTTYPQFVELTPDQIEYYKAHPNATRYEIEHKDDPPIPPYEPSRDEKIHEAIREKYTENDEFMITRQYLANPDNPAFKTAFDEYNAFVEEVLARFPEENV